MTFFLFNPRQFLPKAWKPQLIMDFLRSYRFQKYITLLVFLTIISTIFLLEGEAELDKMAPSEMRDVSGKALLEVETFSGQEGSGGSNNTCSGGGNSCLDFARIEMNLSGQFSGGLGASRLGTYADGGYGGDSIKSDADDASSDLYIQGSLTVDNVTLDQPYVELAYENGIGNELIGFRVGAEEITGTMPFDNVQSISGTVAGDATAGHTFSESSHRTQSISAPSAAGISISPNVVDAFELDDTEDFWLSLNKKDIMWQRNNPAITSTPGCNKIGNGGPCPGSSPRYDFHTDGKGFWLHSTDGVDGTGINIF